MCWLTVGTQSKDTQDRRRVGAICTSQRRILLRGLPYGVATPKPDQAAPTRRVHQAPAAADANDRPILSTSFSSPSQNLRSPKNMARFKNECLSIPMKPSQPSSARPSDDMNEPLVMNGKEGALHSYCNKRRIREVYL